MFVSFALRHSRNLLHPTIIHIFKVCTHQKFKKYLTPNYCHVIKLLKLNILKFAKTRKSRLSRVNSWPSYCIHYGTQRDCASNY